MMIKLNRQAVIGTLLWAAAAVSAPNGGVQVSSAVDKARITIGDLISYSVRLSYPEGAEIDFPGPGANLGGFEIRDYEVKEPRKENGGVVREAVYVISTFLTGEFEIPPLTIYYRLPADSLTRSISTETISITVESMKASEAGDIRGIKPPEDMPRDWRTLILYAAGALLVLLLAGAVFIVLRRRRSGLPLLPEKTDPPRPPHETAAEMLRQLKEKRLPERGEVKRYYIELSEIIRQYIEGRFYLEALEMTTRQILAGLSRAGVQEEVLGSFRDFLEACDLVKFAKRIPPGPEMDSIMEQAELIVEKTKIFSLTDTGEHTADHRNMETAGAACDQADSREAGL